MSRRNCNLPALYQPAKPNTVADIRRQCRFCKRRFWWRATEQLAYEVRGHVPPKKCPACRNREREQGVRLNRPCVDCGEPSHRNTLRGGIEWPCRCARCLELRTYPHIARQKCDAGEWIPDQIYNDLLATETTESSVGVQENPVDYYDTEDDGDQSMSLQQVTEAPTWLAEWQQTIVSADIRSLVDRAFAVMSNRKRTFLEWLRGVDLRAEQMFQKLTAAQDAQTLLEQRRQLIERLSYVFDAGTTLRHKQLQAALEEVRLKSEIAEQIALTGSRIRTLLAAEQSQQQKLLEQHARPLSRREQRQQVIDDHREELRSRSTARRVALADVRGEVNRIMDSAVDDAQAAYEIREVLQSYGLSEDALPKAVQRFLKTAEGDGGY